MAKSGEFGSIPDDIFGLLVGTYTAPNPAGIIAIPDPDRIAGLAALANAEHAAANATKDPHVVTLTVLCIDISKQLDILKAAPVGQARTDAIRDLLSDLKKLEGFWR